MQTVKGLNYGFELHFIKEHLQISNCTFQRLCNIKTKEFNRIDSLYYQFHTEIKKLKTLNDAYHLQKTMYEAYCNIIVSSSYREYPDLIQQALHYINRNWKRKLTLTEIANALSVNKSYLSSIFNKTMHISVTDYINGLRTDWAEILLRSTSLNTTDIACFCGYDDASYFGKVYKKKKGETPLQTRLKNRNFL